MASDMDAAWWIFNGEGDALRLDGTDESASDFDPSLNTNNFTIAGSFSLGTVSPVLQGIFGKANQPVAEITWALYMYYDSLNFAISRDGGEVNTTTITRFSLVADEDYFFCGRYDYITDGTSDMRLDLNGSEGLNTSAVGPVYSTTDADVQIGDIDYVIESPYDGKMYWLAYWNRKLTDQEVEDLREGEVRPCEIPGCVMCIDFHQDVEATYDTEYPFNTDYTFEVEGSPVHAGASEPACFVEIEASGILGHQFAVSLRRLLIDTIPKNDLNKLSEGLGILREEPEQLQVEPVSREPAEERPTEQQRIENAISDLQEWLVAAAEMQKVLGEKLKDRRVTVDPKRNPAVRDSVRRLFGEDSSTITYEMYKQALEWRSKLLEEGREDTYGTGS